MSDTNSTTVDTNSATRTTIEPSALSSGNLATNSSGQTLVYINSSTQISQKLSKNGNYAAWHSQFTNLLFGYDLIGYIDGTIPCPSKTKTPSSSLDPVDNPDHRFWLRQDRLILHAIQTSCTGAVSTLVSRSVTSADAWEKLHTTFANKSTTRMLSLLDSITKISKEGKSVYANHLYSQQMESQKNDFFSIITLLKEKKNSAHMCIGLSYDTCFCPLK